MGLLVPRSPTPPDPRRARKLRDLVREQQVELLWCGTDENPADLLTKAVASKAKFDKFAKWIMGYVDESVLAFMLQCRRRVVTGSDL